MKVSRELLVKRGRKGNRTHMTEKWKGIEGYDGECVGSWGTRVDMKML